MVFSPRNRIAYIVQLVHQVGIRRTRADHISGGQIGKGAQAIASGLLRSDRADVKRTGLAILAEAAETHRKDPMEGHQLADAVLLDMIGDEEITKAFRKCC